jgi:hypothetical protein
MKIRIAQYYYLWIIFLYVVMIYIEIINYMGIEHKHVITKIYLDFIKKIVLKLKFNIYMHKKNHSFIQIKFTCNLMLS